MCGLRWRAAVLARSVLVVSAVLVFTNEACSVFDERLLENHVDASVVASRPGESRFDAGVTDSKPAPNPLDAAALPSAHVAQAGAPAIATGACVQTASADFCGNLPKLPGAPKIDGVLECGLALRPFEPLGWNGAGPLPSAKRASYAAAWRPEGLYLYVHVSEQPVSPHPSAQPLFCGDAVELYVDAQQVDDDAGSYGSGAMQFVIAAPTESSMMEAARFANGAPQGAWISSNFHTSSTQDGYSVEALITAADVGLWQWTPSARIGFSIAIDIAGAPGDANLRCGLQAGQYFLKVGGASAACPGEPWCDVRAFCSAGLLQ
jgi:hypothetical protein